MAIEVGDKAPDFELKDNHGATVRLSDFRGEKNVVLLFYPFAFTGVCTGELCELRDNLPKFAERRHPAARRLQRLRSTPCASSPSRRAWSTRCCPTSGRTARSRRAYGVFDEDKGCAVRGTFIIDKEGVVRWTVVNGLPDARDLNEYVKALDTL